MDITDIEEGATLHLHVREVEVSEFSEEHNETTPEQANVEETYRQAFIEEVNDETVTVILDMYGKNEQRREVDPSHLYPLWMKYPGE